MRLHANYHAYLTSNRREPPSLTCNSMRLGNFSTSEYYEVQHSRFMPFSLLNLALGTSSVHSHLSLQCDNMFSVCLVSFFRFISEAFCSIFFQNFRDLESTALVQWPHYQEGKGYVLMFHVGIDLTSSN